MSVAVATDILTAAIRTPAVLEQLDSATRIRLIQLGLVSYNPLRRTHRVTLKGRTAATQGQLDTCFQCGGLIVITSQDEPSTCPTCR